MPATFPTTQEETLLDLLVCDDAAFEELYAHWCAAVELDDLDYALMRLLPLVSLRLRTLGIAGGYAARIHGVYKMAWVHNQLILSELKSLLPSLESAGMPALVLKGVPLLCAVYRDAGARFAGDADLLVERRHIGAVVALMRGLGWQFIKEGYRAEDPRLGEQGQLAFVHPVSGAEVDVHFDMYEPDIYASTWRLLRGKTLRAMAEYEMLAGHAQEFALGEVSARMPCAEDMLVHVIVHGARYNKHRPVRWVADAVAVMRTYDIDWDVVARTSVRLQVVAEMQTALGYLKSRFNAAVPQAFFDTLALHAPSGAQQARYLARAAGASSLVRTLALLRYRYRGRLPVLAAFLGAAALRRARAVLFTQ